MCVIINMFIKFNKICVRLIFYVMVVIVYDVVCGLNIDMLIVVFNYENNKYYLFLLKFYYFFILFYIILIIGIW